MAEAHKDGKLNIFLLSFFGKLNIFQPSNKLRKITNLQINNSINMGNGI